MISSCFLENHWIFTETSITINDSFYSTNPSNFKKDFLVNYKNKNDQVYAVLSTLSEEAYVNGTFLFSFVNLQAMEQLDYFIKNTSYLNVLEKYDPYEVDLVKDLINDYKKIKIEDELMECKIMDFNLTCISVGVTDDWLDLINKLDLVYDNNPLYPKDNIYTKKLLKLSQYL